MSKIDDYLKLLKIIEDIEPAIYKELDEILLESCYEAESEKDFRDIENISYFKSTLELIVNRIEVKKEKIEDELNKEEL